MILNAFEFKIFNQYVSQIKIVQFGKIFHQKEFLFNLLLLMQIKNNKVLNAFELSIENYLISHSLNLNYLIRNAFNSKLYNCKGFQCYIIKFGTYLKL